MKNTARLPRRAAILLGSVLSFSLFAPALVQAQTPRLLWTQNLTPAVTGFAVTVDGARTDYGLAPLATDGTCGCSLPLPFASGRHTVVVIAYNSAGEAASAPLIVGPTANAGGPYSAQAGTVLTVSAAGSTDETGTITTYKWNWGDGTTDTTSASPSATHAYASGGSFTLTLTVTDDFPWSHSSTTTAAISAPPPPGSPVSPTPTDGASGIPTSPTLSWSAASAASYDVRFGGVNPPPPVSADQSAASYAATGLTAGTTYYWQIVARNSGGTTAGPIWSFTTTPSAPNAPSAPNPTDGATDVSSAPTLTWSASGASTFDVRFGASTPPPQVATDQTGASYAASALSAGTTYFWQIVARSAGGSTDGPIWSFTTASAPTTVSEVVIYAGDVSSSDIHGAWRAESDPTSPDGMKLTLPDAQGATVTTPSAAPESYVDVSFDAEADTPYTVWFRLRASGNSKWNDSVWVQFSDARWNGSPVYALGSSDGLLVNLATDGSGASLGGWGWQNGAYWLSQGQTLTFAAGGPHTLRIQGREDGIQLDQIILSPGSYLSSAPGPATNDTTIVSKDGGRSTAPPPAQADVVIHAADVPGSSLHGAWSLAGDPTSPEATKLITTDVGFAATNAPLASPAHYVDMTFDASADTPYTLWLRMRAYGDAKTNDSLWVQFSDASVGGTPAYRMNSAEGLLINLATDASAASLHAWGWQNRAYWLSQRATVVFSTTGPHTLRLQVREDGIELDQIVLSPGAYLTTTPGPPTDDSTIVSK